MKNVIKAGMVLAALAVVLFMHGQQKKRLESLDAISEEEWDSEPDSTRRLPTSGKSEKLQVKKEKRDDSSLPADLLMRLQQHQSFQKREYNEEFMQGFLSERRDMDKLEGIFIGKSQYGISKNYKAVLLPKGEEKGYYRVGTWTVVPVGYNEQEGYPVLFNKDDRTVSILTGLVSVKLREDVPVEKGAELIAQENGLEVDTFTHHLKIIHVKFYPVTGQSLQDYEKKLTDMGIFARLEFEIYGGGPYPN